jgi:hypothetical protein
VPKSTTQDKAELAIDKVKAAEHNIVSGFQMYMSQRCRYARCVPPG